MKIKTIKNLIILGTIVFSFGIVNNSFAYSCDGYDCDYNSSYGYRSIDSDYEYNNEDDINYRSIGSSEKRTTVNNYYYGSDPYISRSSAIKSSDSSSVKNTNIDLSSNDSNTENDNFGLRDGSSVDRNLLGASAANGLTALSLRGSGGFMPSSIWQWILAGILLLVIIILIRVLINSSNKRSAHH